MDRDTNDNTIPHLTRHDAFKTGLYVIFALSVAIVLIGGTLWLFLAG